MFHSLTFLIGETLRNLRRHALMALACVSTSAVSLTILALFLVIAWQTHAIARAIPRQFEVHAFLRTDLPRTEAEALVARIQGMDGVQRVRLIPREQAWAEYRGRYPHQEDLAGLTENPLPDKLEVLALTPEQTLAVAETVRTLPGVEHVNEGREVLQKLLAIAGIVRLAGLILAGILAAGTAAIIANTIRLTLFARRRDIRVMQLVGATDGFIRVPFVLEGLLAGGIGGLLSGGAMLAAFHYLTTRVLPDVPFVKELRVELDPILFCGVLIAAGAFLGMAGSLLSVRKFLRHA